MYMAEGACFGLLLVCSFVSALIFLYTVKRGFASSVILVRPYRSALPATLQTSQLKLEKGKFPLSRRDQLCAWLCVVISNTVLTADYSKGIGPAEE